MLGHRPGAGSAFRPDFLVISSANDAIAAGALARGRPAAIKSAPSQVEESVVEEMPGPFLKFDSSRFDAGDGEEVWREALRPLYEVWRRKEAPFQARIAVWDLGSMLMTRHFVHDDVQFRRTRAKIASTPADQFLVHCLLGGELASEFHGSQQQVPVGSVALVIGTARARGRGGSAPSRHTHQ